MRDSEIEARVPAALLRRIDGGFCPGAVVGDAWRRSRPEIEGQASLRHVDGWTVLAWWDRSVDSRGACNSAFVARGLRDFTTMLEIGKTQAPIVIARQRTPIVLVEDLTKTAVER